VYQLWHVNVNTGIDNRARAVLYDYVCRVLKFDFFRGMVHDDHLGALGAEFQRGNFFFAGNRVLEREWTAVEVVCGVAASG
jgi:hypothetical protein